MKAPLFRPSLTSFLPAMGALALWLLPVPSARAAAFTWTGGGADDLFSTADNWGGTAPTPGTSNTFTFTGSVRTTPQLDAVSGNSTWLASAITFDSGADSFDIGPANLQTTNRFSLSNAAAITQSSANAQTISATLLIAAGGSAVATGSGSGALTLGSLRMQGNSQLVVDRSVTIGVIGEVGGSVNNRIRINPGAKTVTFSETDTGALDVLTINQDAGGIPGAAPTIQATNAGGFSSAAAVSSNDAIFGGLVGMNFSGNLTVLGSTDKTLTFNNTGGTTFSGATLQFGAASGTGSRTVTLATASAAVATFSGNIIGSASSGTTSITKSGSGTVILSGTNNYNGTTTINAGTFLINGDQSGATGAVAVKNTATLGGSGMIGGTVTLESGSFLAPGESIGTLSGTNVVWDADATLKFELGAAGVSIVSPGTSDFLDLSGSLAEGTGTGSFAFDFLNTGEVGVYKLITADGGFGTFSAGDFSATNLSAGLAGSFSFDSNSLYLTVVPEPPTWGMLGAGLAIMLFWRRARRLRR